MEERPSISTGGIAIGAAIGLASGLTLNYMVLFCQRFLELPWPGPDLSNLPVAVWFIPVLVTTTVLGAVYYSTEA